MTHALLLTLGAALAAAQLACGTCPHTHGTICTFAGTGDTLLGPEGVPAEQSPLYLPMDVTVTPARTYIIDWNNNRIRAVDPKGIINTVVGNEVSGGLTNGPATQSSMNHPTNVVLDPDGNLSISAWHNHRIIKVDLSASPWSLTKLYGTGDRGYNGDEIPGSQAWLDYPSATAFAPDGSLYIADQANQRVRLVDAAGNIHTVVGDGNPGMAGDGQLATLAEMQGPIGQSALPSNKLISDALGNLYIADSGNNRVRKVTTDGMISTIAGSGNTRAGIDPAQHGGDGGPATQAQLARPTDVALGPDGSLYIADTDNSCIRKVDGAGIITTVAGICGTSGYNGDGRQATQAQLHRPFGIDVGPDGALYIADTYNARVRVVYP